MKSKCNFLQFNTRTTDYSVNRSSDVIGNKPHPRSVYINVLLLKYKTKQVLWPVGNMTSKAPYTYHILLVSLAIISGCIIRLPLTLHPHTKRSLGYPRDSLLNFTELTTKYGYSTEEHTAVTDDGYLLKIFRVQGKNCEKKKPPVVLMHGLLQSADVWLDAGPGAALAYLLADDCHDLWVGNQRGNYYSRTHLHLDPDRDAKFWHFSVDEIGLYDIPATIDYVLKKTGAEKLNYIGYSQGSGTYFIMCSERPGYCDKANVLIGLAPASRQTHTKSVPYRTLMKTIDTTRSILSFTGIQEVFSKGAFSQEFMGFLCQLPMMSNGLCNTIEALFDSNHPGSITNETTRVLFSHFPAGTSVQNLARYGQSMKSQKFEKFNYGKDENMKIYNSEIPPEYNLSAVTVPVMILYGKNDYLVDPKDVRWLLRRLPNVLEAQEVKDPLWNHLDVPYSQYTSELIYPKISEYLNKFSK